MNKALQHILAVLRLTVASEEKSTPFYPAYMHSVDRHSLVKILSGNVSNEDSALKADRRVLSYFIISNSVLNEYDLEKQSMRLNELENPIELLNSSQWFGKFTTYTQSQIIIPGRYDLKVNPFEKKVYLEENNTARYYGSGNLQWDKDYSTSFLVTDLNFNDLRNIVNKICFSYQYSNTLYKWK